MHCLLQKSGYALSKIYLSTIYIYIYIEDVSYENGKDILEYENKL
jgi:hypothetical protein